MGIESACSPRNTRTGDVRDRGELLRNADEAARQHPVAKRGVNPGVDGTISNRNDPVQVFDRRDIDARSVLMEEEVVADCLRRHGVESLLERLVRQSGQIGEAKV
jgi:hypothetical protein